jgi:outer membrane receptor protein involved in Fe transport
VNSAVNWVYDNFAFTWRANYFSDTNRTSNLTARNQPDIFAPEFLRIKERFTHDFQASFTTDQRFNFYIGVNNAFNQLPDVGLTFYPVPATGRTVYAGVRVSTDRFPF